MVVTEIFHEIRLSIVLPARLSSGPSQGHWTYEDYKRIPDDGQRYEVMNGVLIMTPSPTEAHQIVVTSIGSYLRQYVTLAGIGKALVAPFEVVLSPEKVVQPDVVVVLQKQPAQLTSSDTQGRPDIVVEVSSSGTAAYDRLSKFSAYEQAGITEYWLVDPLEKNVELFMLKEGKYQSQGIFNGKDALPSQVVPAIAAVPVELFFV